MLRCSVSRRGGSCSPAARGGGGRGAGALGRAELAVTAAAVVAGVTLTSLPPPGPQTVAGSPLVRVVRMDDASTGLVVVPGRPGVNLVHVMSARFTDVGVGGREYEAQPRPDTEGRWVEIVLPAGRSLLEVRQGRNVVQQVLDTGHGVTQSLVAGPDGVECASAALGALLGGSTAPVESCPSESLSDSDANVLRLLVRNLAERKVKKIRLVADETPRAVAADVVVREAARTAGIEVGAGAAGDVVLAVAGWGTARTALDALRSAPPPLYGTYLAPWLVQAPIVAVTGTAPLAALPFDPQSDLVRAYVSALRRVGPAQSATSAGLAAFLAARGERLGDEVELYAATGSITVMPMGSDMAAHDDGAGPGWLAGGALTPVSTNLAQP